MSYVKRPVMLKRGTTFLAWKAASKARQEDLFEMFTANFEAMQITDLPSAADYREEIKGMLWKNFESIAYVFHVFASGGSTGAGGNRADGQGLGPNTGQHWPLFRSAARLALLHCAGCSKGVLQACLCCSRRGGFGGPLPRGAYNFGLIRPQHHGGNGGQGSSDAKP